MFWTQFGPIGAPKGNATKSTRKKVFLQNAHGASAGSTFWACPRLPMSPKTSSQPLLGRSWGVPKGPRESLHVCSAQARPRNPPGTPREPLRNPRVGTFFGTIWPQKTAQRQRNEGQHAKNGVVQNVHGASAGSPFWPLPGLQMSSKSTSEALLGVYEAVRGSPEWS